MCQGTGIARDGAMMLTTRQEGDAFVTRAAMAFATVPGGRGTCPTCHGSGVADCCSGPVCEAPE
jgi:hypothetical protein